MTGTGGKPQPPGDEVPNNPAQQRAHDRGHVDVAGFHQSLANGLGASGAHERTDEFKNGRNGDALAGGQDFGRHHRGDGIGGVMETIDQFEDQRDEHDQKNEPYCGSHERASGVFQDDVEHDIAGVATTVEHLLQNLVKVLQHDGLHCFVLAAIKVAQPFQHQLVRVAFDLLQLPVQFLYSFEIRFLAENGDHLQKGGGCLVHHGEVVVEINVAQARRAQDVTLGKLFDRLRYFVERVGKRFDVFTLQGSHEGVHQQITNLGRQLLFLAP